MPFYLDTSAVAKLVVSETETPALRTWLGHAERHPVACDLVRTELMRAVRRAAPGRAVYARNVLGAITLMDVTTTIFEHAGRLDPASLRSLDAIHVAAALELGDELEGLVTYDERLREAAEANGIATLAPA